MSKCLQEDNLNLKGLALFSLHPRAYITTTQRVENNIHSRLCLQGTTCNYLIYAPPSQRPKNITGTSLCCIKTAQEEHFQAACMTLVSTKTKEIYFLFYSKQNTCTCTECISKLILPCSFSNLYHKSACFLICIFNIAMLCKGLCFFVFKQHNVKPFHTSAFCWNKWYRCSKAILPSYFSSGRSVQSQFSSASDIKNYECSKRMCWSAWGHI